MCARTTAKCKKELSGTGEEDERQCVLPRVVLLKADFSGVLCPGQLKPESLHIKEEEGCEGVHHIKEEPEHLCINEEDLDNKEEEQKEIITLPSMGLPLKSEGDPNEYIKGAEPTSSSASPHRRTGIYGDHCQESQADTLVAPLSNSDGVPSHSPHTDDDGEQSEDHANNKCWECSDCGKILTCKANLQQHMRKHTGEKPFHCSVCGQTFSLKSTLTSHTRTHTGDKPFVCSVCGQRFAQRTTLTAHTRIHTGEKPFACLVCGQRFTRKGGLNVHTRTHTGEKPYACSFCGKRFSENGTLKSHMRIHTWEKPFICSVCGQRFGERGTLTVHMRTHTGEKPYVCLVCGQRFSHKRTLISHTRKHTGEKLYSCSECPKQSQQ
ncbi:gastrula zinc finger protein XlCGF8.2DB-like isoform X2 [Syngnathoides biaculeatus]|nr:gastrula zinc finger protein XlCGF8.2DB-like isoform X2 [Syngnathoides biaculeatus]